MTIRSRLPLAILLLACAGASPAFAQAQKAAPAPAPAPAAAAAQPTADSVRQAVKADRRGVVEKYMQLTPEEAKRFWPVYDKYIGELDKITARQNRVVLDYVNTESSMSDGNAKRLVHELLEADAAEQKLREKTVKSLMGPLPAKKAARFLQIENKIRTLGRYDLAERIQLVR